MLAVGLILFIFTGGTLCLAQAGYEWLVSTEMSNLPNNQPGPCSFPVFINTLLTKNTEKVVKFKGKAQSISKAFPLCGAQKKGQVIIQVYAINDLIHH
jgi:hypothetical protein